MTEKKKLFNKSLGVWKPAQQAHGNLKHPIPTFTTLLTVAKLGIKLNWD